MQDGSGYASLSTECCPFAGSDTQGSRSERVFLRGLQTISGVSTVIVLRELHHAAMKTFEEKKVGLAEIMKAPMHKSAQKDLLAGKDLSQPQVRLIEAAKAMEKEPTEARTFVMGARIAQGLMSTFRLVD